MDNMALHELTLQHLRQRYVQMLPWFRTVTRAQVEIRPTGRGNAFTLIARWGDGQVHQKHFSAEVVRSMPRVGCSKRLADIYVREVLLAKGEIDEDD